MSVYQCGLLGFLCLMAWVVVVRTVRKARLREPRRRMRLKQEVGGPIVLRGIGKVSSIELQPVGRRRRRRRRCHYDRFYQDLVRDL
jgi:hypothetical protein